MRVRALIIFIALINLTEVHCQEFLLNNDNTILRGGITFDLGSHKNRFGVFTSAHHRIGSVVLNAGLSLKYNRLGLGPRAKGIETIIKLKAKTGFIQTPNFYESLASPEEFLTNYKYTIGYAINFYLNEFGTRQKTGTIDIRVHKIGIKHENDILAERASDKFRTAGISFNYHDSLNIYSIKTTLWTGNKDNEMAKRVYDKSFARFGYIDLSSTPMGRYSHGIINLSVRRDLALGLISEFELGMDHEKIRNTIQNKFMHDMDFWPEKLNGAKNLHIPMVDTYGNAYIYGENQILKPGSIYFQLNVNSSEFY